MLVKIIDSLELVNQAFDGLDIFLLHALHRKCDALTNTNAHGAQCSL